MSMTTDGVEPITDHVHTGSWSANLEQPDHADDRDLVVEQAFEGIDVTYVDRCGCGGHVTRVFVDR